MEVQGDHTPCGHHQGWPAPRGAASLVSSSTSALWFRVAPRKIGRLAFVPSNSENIDFLPFLEPKTEENRQLALWYLVNRLILENA